MERILEIQKFRNIGLNGKEKLVLNSSMKKGEIGNLIIVVGANNSGKSNVLDALTCFGDKKMAERDITTLSYSEEDRIPFGKQVGLGTIIVGIGIIVFSVLSSVTLYTENDIFILVGTAVLIIGIILGLVISFRAMIKYNKGIF